MIIDAVNGHMYLYFFLIFTFPFLQAAFILQVFADYTANPVLFSLHLFSEYNQSFSSHFII